MAPAKVKEFTSDSVALEAATRFYHRAVKEEAEAVAKDINLKVAAKKRADKAVDVAAKRTAEQVFEDKVEQILKERAKKTKPSQNGIPRDRSKNDLTPGAARGQNQLNGAAKVQQQKGKGKGNPAEAPKGKGKGKGKSKGKSTSKGNAPGKGDGKGSPTSGKGGGHKAKKNGGQASHRKGK